MKHIARIIATTCYSGYFPFAPGTVGSVIGLVLFWFIPEFRGMTLASASVVLFFLGVWAATVVDKVDGTHDAGLINVDEVVGMWISLLFLPSNVSVWWWIVAFFLFRGFDIVKPFPAGWAQKLPRGWGVMIDDVFAGIYANLVLQIILRLILG